MQNRDFVPIADLQTAVDRFLSRYGVTVSNHTAKISAYAEIAAYNALVGEYRRLRYGVVVRNIVGNTFRYKMQPQGDPRNYSYFTVTRRARSFDILNNISIESAHVERRYYSADIAVVNADSLRIEERGTARDIGTLRTSYSVRNQDVQTFLEVKNLPAFPALLFSFSGLLYEFMPEIFRGKRSEKKVHIAPSLVCSFIGSGHALVIRTTLLNRWHINIFVDLLHKRRLAVRGDDEEIRLIGNRGESESTAPGLSLRG